MHRSRLGSIGIDCSDLEAGVAFWGQALGWKANRSNEPCGEETYADLTGGPGEQRVFLQKVPEPKTAKTRVHLDIESDDVEAEVRRLEGLGARRRENIESWWVMEDPFGNEFCVVDIETGGWPERTHEWA